MRLPAKATIKLLKETAAAWTGDYAPSMGAALSYYTLFSIAPLLLIVIGVAGLVFGAEAARGEIFGQLAGLIGAEGAKAVESVLRAADRPAQGVVATIVGVFTLLLGAATVFGELQNALDRIWRAPVREVSKGWWSLLRTRLLSFGMVLGIAFLLTVSLVLSAAIAALGKWWGPAAIVAHALETALSFGLTTALFALIYKFIPRVHVGWHDVWMGAAVTALLFAVGKLLIGLYLGKSSVASPFGAAGSLVVLMLWVYYSAQIFLFGAEFTWVYAREHGSRRSDARHGPEIGPKAYPRPKPAANEAVPPARPGLRARHPFGSLGVAFIAGVGLAAAKSVVGQHLPALKRRLT
jgi:membrane protein